MPYITIKIAEELPKYDVIIYLISISILGAFSIRIRVNKCCLHNYLSHTFVLKYFQLTYLTRSLGIWLPRDLKP